MKTILYERTETVTPEMAYRWLTENNYIHNRPRSPRAVANWKRIIETGQFRLGSQIRFCMNGDGKEVLTDGQHRLEALFESGKALPMSIICLKADTEDEIAEEYAYTDIMGKRRTASDSGVALGHPEKFQLTKTQCDRLYSAIQVIRAGFTQPQNQYLDRKETNDAMEEWAEAMRTVEAWTLEGGPDVVRPLHRRGILSVALVSVRYAPTDKTQPFWTQAIFDDGVHLADPRKTLHKFLLNSRTNGSNGPSGNRAYSTLIVSEETRMVAAAWNAWVEGRELQILRAPSTTRPIEIKLTPYNGK